MNVNSILAKDYDKMETWLSRKNEPKTNPIQSQTNPILAQNKLKHSQNQPKQTQFQRLKMLYLTIIPGLFYRFKAEVAEKDVSLARYNVREQIAFKISKAMRNYKKKGLFQQFQRKNG